MPNGGPGIENRLHMLLDVRRARRAGSRRTASWSSISTNIAKLFGLYPRKGTIAPGLGRGHRRLGSRRRSSRSPPRPTTPNVNYNLFEGEKVTGAPEVVLVRGQVIVEGDELVAQPGAGQFVKRARFGEELLPQAKAVA